MSLPPNIIIAEEGESPERQYFDHIGRLLRIKLARANRRKGHSGPLSVLQDMEEELKKTPHGNYEAWIIIDRDTHDPKHIDACLAWAGADSRRHLALSNPCIEFWILLHFHNKISYKRRRCAEYKKEKEAQRSQFTKAFWKYFCHSSPYDIKTIGKIHIRRAIKYAKKLDTPPCADYPDSCGSTVYHLMEKLLPPAP